jgi:hypothetical protein
MLSLGIAAAIVLGLGGGLFWLWLQATHGEIGPAAVATGLSMVVIFGVMAFGLKLQDGGGGGGESYAEESHLPLPQAPQT